jgi:hypothetical protein
MHRSMWRIPVSLPGYRSPRGASVLESVDWEPPRQVLRQMERHTHERLIACFCLILLAAHSYQPDHA